MTSVHASEVASGSQGRRGRRGTADLLGPAEAVDPRWRRRVVVLGAVSAAVVTAGMVPHLAPWSATVALALAVGLALWLVELFATPSSRVVEALVLVGVGGAGAVLNAADPQSPGFVLAYFAVAGLGIRFVTRPAAVLAAVVIAAVDAGILSASASVGTSLTTSDLGLAFVFVVAAATRSARATDARSTALLAELEESRAAEEAAVALAERTRLAREIHDILAHSLSGQVMSLEATRMLAERSGADARVVGEIERAHRLARSGLADIRRAIGALRGDALPGPELLPALVQEAQAAHGVRTTLTVEGQPRAVPAEAGLSLYRTAQEALTNTAKHAGRGACASVELRWSEDAVELTVSDERRADDPDSHPLPSGGYGLTGLRERAELVGGTLHAGPTATGFRVALSLPLSPARHADEGPR
ncbi:MAG TPA: histidine kinase [Nocardioidaceae bacterium]|nr:histidine kinase [Nocardioidaceae bacterium]